MVSFINNPSEITTWIGSKQRQGINVKSTSKFNVETTLILVDSKNQFCSYIMMLEILKSLY